jgi:hypothetical protein
VTSGPDVVDVLVADHAAPKVVETLRGRTRRRLSATRGGAAEWQLLPAEWRANGQAALRILGA